ncbi:MAG: CHAT domain-containing protein [Symploca sp. SIO2G7]|nr:CHAT domain-containing protein [Symploca sp. SIO2G7]
MLSLFKRMSQLLMVLVLAGVFGWERVRAQSILPAADGTGTIVTPDGKRFDINGGSLSGDGTNLFHSFEQFGLSHGEIANFLSNPQIQNILGRIVGGDPSIINGLIQVTGGNSHLFLMNPSGFVFGTNAQLQVPASFTVTTGDGIGFGSNWFSAAGGNDFQALVGNPTDFGFAIAQSGAIINAGNLVVGSGQDLTLLGGTVVNTGRLSAPGGEVIVTAVPGGNRVRLTVPGNVLSLEVEPIALSGSQPNDWTLPITALPTLLTVGASGLDTGLTLNGDGTVQVTASGVTVPTESGTAIVSGKVDVSGELGGNVGVFGEKVGLVGAEVEASGSNGGGTVLVGGDYQGLGTVPNAEVSFVSGDSVINADALVNGDGGRVIVWADKVTGFYGDINARGGSNSGNGGFVEVSGKESLAFNGNVDVSAANGTDGTILLDPRDIIIEPDDGLADDNGQITPGIDEEILLNDGGNVDFQIDDTALTALTGNILLQAQQDIIALDGTNLNFTNQTFGKTITFEAGRNIQINTRLTTAGGSVELTATNGTIIFNSINTGVFTGNAGSVTLQAAGNITSMGDFLVNLVDPDEPLIVVDTANSSINASVSVFGTGNGGQISLTSTNGSIDTSSGDLLSVTPNGMGGTVDLQALQGQITIKSIGTYVNPTGNAGSITLEADGDITTTGSLGQSGGTLISSTRNGNGGQISLTSNNGSINTSSGEIRSFSVSGNGGAITFSALNEINTSGISSGTGINGGDITLTSNEINFNGGSNSITGGAIQLQPSTVDQDIQIGDTTDSDASTLDLTSTDIAALEAGFTSITIGRSDGTGTVTLNSGITFNDPVNIAGGSTLVGPNQDTTWNITGTNQGDLNSIFPNTLTFSNIENLTGGSSNDTFVFSNGVNVGGTISDNGGTDTLDYSAFTTPLTVNLNTIGAAGIEQIVGTTATESTLIGTDTVNTWNITSTNSGDINGTFSFTNFGNLTGGNLDDTFQFSEGASVSGNISGGAGNLTLTGDEIDFGGNLSGTGSLTFQPLTTTQAIQIGGTNTGSSSILDLTGTELSLLQNGFTSITIGRADGSGGITLAGDVTFNDPVTLEGGTGSINHTNGSLTGADDATITLQAQQNITTGNIINPGRDITITSNNGAIATGNLDSSGTSGGDIIVNASTTITADTINSSGSEGDGGDVTLDPSGDIQVTSINAQGGINGTGGNVDITTGQFFRSTGTFTDQNGIDASISTAGGNGGGQVIIRHDGGNLDTPFVVGDATTNGTAGAITTGTDNSILPTRSFPGPFNQGTPPSDIQLITQGTNFDEPEDLQEPSEPPFQNETERPIGEIIYEVEEHLTNQVDEYLGQTTRIKTLDEIRNELREIVEATDGEVKPGIIYVFFPPRGPVLRPEISSEQPNSPEGLDVPLQLVLVTSEGEVISKFILEALRKKVLNQASIFHNDVQEPSHNYYEKPAEQFYQWLIAPLKEALSKQQINNLVFVMDEGLRSLPLATLRNPETGKHIIEENYSIGLTPSMSLTDTRRIDISQAPVLGMGAEEFPGTKLDRLPAVPVELRTITQSQRAESTPYLNEDFTVDNLKSQRGEQQFGIIHLATHADFKSGTSKNSYVQFYDKRITLDKIPELKLNESLLVLSACRTALGDKEAELGFAGLARQAGVKSVLASLWKVNDVGTLGLMTQFYQQLQSEAAPIRAEALKQAQLAMLSGQVKIEDDRLKVPGLKDGLLLPPEIADSKDLSHPSYWSGFTVVGNPW